MFIPDVAMVFTALISGLVLLCRLNGKSAHSMEPDDFNLSKALVGLAIVNFLIMIPNIIISGVLLKLDKDRDLYDFSATVDANLKYTARITGKFAGFVSCITFFVLLFGRQFRSCCCKN